MNMIVQNLRTADDIINYFREKYQNQIGGDLFEALPNNRNEDSRSMPTVKVEVDIPEGYELACEKMRPPMVGEHFLRTNTFGEWEVWHDGGPPYDKLCPMVADPCIIVRGRDIVKLSERLKRYSRLRDARLKAKKVGGVVSLARQLRIQCGATKSAANASLDLGGIPKFTNYVMSYRATE